MSEYLSDKPKTLIIKDSDGNIKNSKEFDHNTNGDPTYYKKLENNKVIVELVYEYVYDDLGRRLSTKITDKVTNKVTIMEYSY